LIEGLGLSQIGIGTLHELALGVLAAEAVGLALEARTNGAIRLHVLVIGKAPTAHIVELTGCREGRRGEAKADGGSERGRGYCPCHDVSPGSWGFSARLWAAKK